jgi:hypothetical protein
MYKIPVVCIVCFFFSLSLLHASEQIITSEHTHSMSDNESKNDARRNCFIAVKKKLFAKTMVFFSKQKSVKMEAIAEKDIEQCLPVLLEIDIMSEKWELAENQLLIKMVVQTIVDKNYLEKRLLSLHKDNELQKKIKTDQARLKTLEKEYIAFEKVLATADEKTAIPFRKERQIISTEMDKIEKIRYVISSKTKLASDYISIGMTIDELVEVAGQPRSTATCEKPDFLNYGDIWIWINNGIVIAKIPMVKWSGPCYRYSLTDRDTKADTVIKGLATKDKTEKHKYSILLKSGKTILTSMYYTVDDIIYYKKYGGIVGLEEDKVEEVKEIE